ncbi:MAG: cytidine/deoxycytidylate deaminase family protein [Patescibacteria group bacterium]|nr:cytidine/deoxycytidylate deaminase family protein [Patescibacteria group bacterium]
MKKTKQGDYMRYTWDEYFVTIMEVVGGRATCDRGRSGCIIAKDKRILSTGYVGSPAGTAHCDDAGHEMHTVVQEDGTQSRHCIRTSHAEQNALANAARSGVSTDGATIYVHMTPCYTCAKMLINAGIKRVVANLDYHGGGRSKEIFKEAGVEFVLLNSELQKYEDMK